MPKIYIDLNNTSWTEILNPTNEEDKTIYVSGKSLVNILTSTTPIEDFSSYTYPAYKVIGGILSSCDVLAGQYVYAKTGITPNQIFLLTKGFVDPDKDINGLLTQIDEVAEQLTEHASDEEDPHDVTKEQVGLEHIPDTVLSVVPNVATGALINDYALLTVLNTILQHINNADNPHATNPSKIGLSAVVNKGVATTEEQMLDPNNVLHATINAVHTILIAKSEQFSPIPPGRIIGGNTEILNNTDKLLYSPDSEVVLLDGLYLVIRAGLRVSYHDGITTRLSQILAGDINFNHTQISTEINPRPGWHYLYVNVSEVGVIYQVGSKYIRPTYGITPTVTDADFIYTPTGLMKNADGNTVRRVYIAKVYVEESGLISYIVNIPQGNTHIQRIDVDIFPNATYIFDNPFMEPVLVIPEIKIGTQWADPKWNDQIGVIASSPIATPDDIVVQTGALGLAAVAVNSGSAFSTANLPVTYNSSAKLRLIITRL